MFWQMMRHSLRVGLASFFLISSTRTRIIWRRLSGAGLLLLAMADCTSSGILSHGTSKVSFHLVLADWLTLLEVQGDDAREELDSEDEEEQGNGLESEDRLVSVESTGKNWTSSVTVVVSETHENKIKHITSLFSQYLSHVHANQYQKHERL